MTRFEPWRHLTDRHLWRRHAWLFGVDLCALVLKSPQLLLEGLSSFSEYTRTYRGAIVVHAAIWCVLVGLVFGGLGQLVKLRLSIPGYLIMCLLGMLWPLVFDVRWAALDRKRALFFRLENDVFWGASTHFAQAQGPQSTLEVAPLPFAIGPDQTEAGIVIVGTNAMDNRERLHACLKRLRELGETALIVDPDGELLSCFYDEGRDVILTPGDKRSAAWAVGQDILSAVDMQVVAASLFPIGEAVDASLGVTPGELFAAVGTTFLRSPTWPVKDSSIWVMAFTAAPAKLERYIGSRDLRVRWRALTDAQRMHLHQTIIDRLKPFHLSPTNTNAPLVSLRRRLSWAGGEPGFIFLSGGEAGAVVRRVVTSVCNRLPRDGAWLVAGSMDELTHIGAASGMARFITTIDDEASAAAASASLDCAHLIVPCGSQPAWVRDHLPHRTYQSQATGLRQRRPELEPWELRLLGRTHTLYVPANRRDWIIFHRERHTPLAPTVEPFSSGDAKPSLSASREPLPRLQETAPPLPPHVRKAPAPDPVPRPAPSPPRPVPPTPPAPVKVVTPTPAKSSHLEAFRRRLKPNGSDISGGGTST